MTNLGISNSARDAILLQTSNIGLIIVAMTWQSADVDNFSM